MPIKTENQIMLSDGSAVGYAEYGDLMGNAVIHLHGCPSSRFEPNNPDLIAIAERLHIRLIVPERPGIGLSDWKSYTIAGYPALLVQFADKFDKPEDSTHAARKRPGAAGNGQAPPRKLK